MKLASLEMSSCLLPVTICFLSLSSCLSCIQFIPETATGDKRGMVLVGKRTGGVVGMVRRLSRGWNIHAVVVAAGRPGLRRTPIGIVVDAAGGITHCFHIRNPKE